MPESLVLQLDKDYGGLLQCNIKDYDIIVDIKQSIVYNHYHYSDIRFPSSLNVKGYSDISSLKCDNILYKRNDYSMINPMVVRKSNLLGKHLVLYCDEGIFFVDHSRKDIIKFACYSPNSDKRITEYTNITVSYFFS